MATDYITSPVQETAAPRPPSPTVAPLTPPADDEEQTRQTRSSPSFDYHQERRLHLKDEIWLSHHLPRLPPPTSDDVGHGKSALSTSPRRARTTPHEIMMDTEATVGDPSPSAFHPPRKELDLPANVQQGGRSMSMDDDDDHDHEHDREALRNERRRGSNKDMLSPAFMGEMDPRPAMIHRQELDSQERLDLEEERRERELSGGQAGAEQAAPPGLQGELRHPSSSTSQPRNNFHLIITWKPIVPDLNHCLARARSPLSLISRSRRGTTIPAMTTLAAFPPHLTRARKRSEHLLMKPNYLQNTVSAANSNNSSASSLHRLRTSLLWTCAD